MLAWNREADYFLQMIKDQFDTLYEKGRKTAGSCAFRCIRTISGGPMPQNISTRRCGTSSATMACGRRLPTTSPSITSPTATTRCRRGLLHIRHRHKPMDLKLAGVESQEITDRVPLLSGPCALAFHWSRASILVHPQLNGTRVVAAMPSRGVCRGPLRIWGRGPIGKHTTFLRFDHRLTESTLSPVDTSSRAGDSQTPPEIF